MSVADITELDGERPNLVPDHVPVRPHAEVAPDTHPVELRRLALEEAQHPDCDPLSVQAGVWIIRASNAILTDQADNLRDLNLSTSAFNVLMILHNTPAGTLEPCDIAQRLLVTGPSVTGLLDTLEGKGLIQRRLHPEDRRRRLVCLTPAAHEILHENLTVHYAGLRHILADLSCAEREQLVTLLRKVSGATPPALQTSPALQPPAPQDHPTEDADC